MKGYGAYRDIFFGIVMLMVWNGAYAQMGSIAGRISDSLSKMPLSGANIVLAGSRTVTTSDFDGRYSFNDLLPGAYKVQVSYIGYQTITKTIYLTEREAISMDFHLAEITYVTDEAVITGSRIQISRNIIPLTVSVIHRKDIEQSGESNILPVLSGRIPGVYVTERSVTGYGVGDGSAGKITVRGIGGNPNTQVLVLIDGHPQYMGIFGHPLPDAYVASDVEKVEVIRGPASILYGSNAMGGTLNIITRQQQLDGLSLFANAQYGSYNTLKYTGGAGFKKEKFHIMASFNHDQSDGHRNNCDFSIDNGYIKAGYELTSHLRLTVNGSLAAYDATDPGSVYTTDSSFQNNGHWSDFVRGEGALTLENNYNKSEGALKLFLNAGDHKIYDGFHSTDQNWGIQLYQGLKFFTDNLITLGADYRNYGGMAENTLPEIPVLFTDTSIYEYGFYGLVQQTIFKKITLTGGVRLETNEMFGPEWIPQAGLTYGPDNNTVIRAVVSKGFRSPTIRELFLFISANPELQPERMWNYETGLTRYFLNSQLMFELNGFYAVGDNLIETTGQFPHVENTNTGSFRHYGIEFMAKYAVTSDLHTLANYSWLHTDRPVVAAPAHMVFLEGIYQPGKFIFNLNASYVNQLVLKSNPEVITQNYLLINARITYNITPWISIFLKGENLTDQKYEINYGYPMPGITALGGVNLRYDIRKKKE
jgi:iron complex outermembrane receptor protein